MTKRSAVTAVALALTLGACGSSSGGGGSAADAHNATSLRQLLAGAPLVHTFRLTFTQTRSDGQTTASTTQTSLYDLSDHSYEITETQAGKTALQVIHTPTAQYVRVPGKPWVKYVVPTSLIAPVRQPGQSMQDLIPSGAKVSTHGQQDYSIAGSLAQIGAGTNDLPAAISSLQGSASGQFTMSVALQSSGLPLHEHDQISFSASGTKAVITGDRSYSDYNTAGTVTAPSAATVQKTIHISSLAQLQAMESASVASAAPGAATASSATS